MDKESKILKMSVLGTTFFAAFGISWGWLIDSEMILFDGIYSLIGVILSSASLTVYKIIKERDNRDFYFGKYILEPLVVSFNSMVMILVCLYSGYNSLTSIASGGNSVDIGSALIYSIVSAIGCYLVYKFIDNRNKKEFSELMKSERNQWFMDFLLSFAVLIGFIGVIILKQLGYTKIIPYVDPLMVLVASIFCIKNPLRVFYKNIKEVFGLINPDRVIKQVENQIKSIKEEYCFSKTEYKVKKIGRSIKIEVNFAEEDYEKDITLEDIADIKDIFQNKIDTGKYFKDVEITFDMGEDMYIELT